MSKPCMADDTWTSSRFDMDNTLNPSLDSHDFINHGFLLWNQSRQHWIGNKRNRQRNKPREPRLSKNVTYDSLLGSNKPFAKPVPLSEMVDFLGDVWEQEGLDVRCCLNFNTRKVFKKMKVVLAFLMFQGGKLHICLHVPNNGVIPKHMRFQPPPPCVTLSSSTFFLFFRPVKSVARCFTDEYHHIATTGDVRNSGEPPRPTMETVNAAVECCRQQPYGLRLGRCRYWISISVLHFLLWALFRSKVVSAHPPHPFFSLVRCCNAAFSHCCGYEGCRCHRHAP
ncbi:unnamed protein product [Lactuca saligna]|nr:unnamed protein product [Lactuca saligna]